MPPDPKVLELARDALLAAMRKQVDDTTEHLRALIHDHPRGIQTALLAWCDTVAQHLGVDPDDGTVKTLTFWDTESGHISDLSQVDPVYRWAGRLITARAAMDQDAYAALCAIVDDLGPQDRGKHVIAVLNCAAMTINGVPAGSARSTP